MGNQLVRLQEVCKSYHAPLGGHDVLRNVSLEIRERERLAIVGPNGSGKTTLIRLMLGIELPNRGTVQRLSPWRGTTAYVPQDYRNSLFPWLRLGANLALLNCSGNSSGPVPRSPRLTSHDSAEFSLLCARFRFHFDLNKFPYQLSGGEQQGFLLIRAMLNKPALLVMDEGLSAVDYARKQMIMDHLGRLLPELSTTFVFASHDFEEAVLLSDRVVVLSRETGGIQSTVPVRLPWPRTRTMRNDDECRATVDEIIKAVTS